MTLLDFVKPDKIIISEISDNKGIFCLKPLEPGYGITLGNSLRRVLLGSLKGYAVTSIQIKDVKYEFSTVKGIVEDVTEIILNFKKVRFKKILPGVNQEIVNANVIKGTIVTGEIINKFISGFKILNKDLVICNKVDNVPFDIKFSIEEGRGYVPAEKNKKDDYNLVGIIPIDSIFTPIKNVRFYVENCRIGKRTDFESLSLEIKTDGSITPKSALIEASKVLVQYFSIFSKDKIGKAKKEKLESSKKYNEEYLKMKNLFRSKLNEMDLSVRTKNCLKYASIKTIFDLVSYKKSTILKIRNFGKKSLEELEKKMKEKGLYFGMKISEYKINVEK